MLNEVRSSGPNAVGLMSLKKEGDTRAPFEDTVRGEGPLEKPELPTPCPWLQPPEL